MWRPAVVTLCALSVGEMGCSLFRRESAPGRVQVGLASWYDLPGRSTASGERYDQTQLTAAHRSLPLGTRVLVTNLANGKSVRVRINDRGPFARGRVIDVSRAAARRLGMIGMGTTRVGRLGPHRVRRGAPFFEIARYSGLGYGELVEANPGIARLIPPVGKDLVLPTEWILPCCTYDGIVVNVPEMRLYFYRHAPDDPKSRLVETFPVGIGRESWRTPRGQFHIRRKTVNPRWVIPESIRQEHIREYGDTRHSIAGGDPDNPLGKYRMELSLPPFSIHGTDIPWGIGMQVTHGCVRLYPEDMEHLFPLAPVGTRVEFTYQPVKVGRRHGEGYVWGHRDVYRYGGPAYRRTPAVLTRQGLNGGGGDAGRETAGRGSGRRA